MVIFVLKSSKIFLQPIHRWYRWTDGRLTGDTLLVMGNYDHVFYLDCPHFTVGRVDQWGENGYLFFENMVYSYEEDRKNQCGSTYSPMTTEDFIKFAEQQNVSIPDHFLEIMSGAR